MVPKIKSRRSSQNTKILDLPPLKKMMEKSPSSICVKTYKSVEQRVKVVFKTCKNHLAMLAKNFKKYFLDEDSLVASYEWIRDLFQDTPEGALNFEEEIFIDFIQ
ncbi:zinc finger BED domain-containing protein 5 [Trichonephila clavipes]|nr:zinc finger BED domain-containing protein 5 [Trichonephila clavipes]